MAANGDKAGALNDRELGGCPVCAWPVRFGDNFIRIAGLFVHVRCALVRRSGSPDFRQSAAA